MHLTSLTAHRSAWYVSMTRDGRMYLPSSVLANPPLDGAPYILVSYGTDADGHPVLALVGTQHAGENALKVVCAGRGAGTVAVGWIPWKQLRVPTPDPPAGESQRYDPVLDERYGLLIYLDRLGVSEPADE